MILPSILLHFGGAGTYTAASVIAAMFFVLFGLSFVLGSRPQGSRRFSREWARAWLKASLPRLIVTGAFAGALFVASSLTGGGQASEAERTCRQPVAAYTTDPVTAERLRAAIAGRSELAAAAARDDENEVLALFFGTDTHNVTHDIDHALRETDPALARGLCRSVVTLELQLSGNRDMTVVQREAEAASASLGEAGRVTEILP